MLSLSCSSTSNIRATNISENDVAYLTLFTYDGNGEAKWGLPNLGHAFVSIENVSGDTLNILDKELASGETIAIGTWSIKEHFGVWYNVESNYIIEHNKYDGRLSITIGVSMEDIETISSYIADKDYWNIFNNCSKFALNLWNTVATETEEIEKPLIYTPSYLARQIKKFDNYEVNREINTDDTLGYFNDATFVSFHIEEGNYESV